MSYDFNDHADEAAKDRNEIAKCPVCGDAPVIWGDDYGDIHIQCCDMHTTYGRRWNQYAAMELARVGIEYENSDDSYGDEVLDEMWKDVESASRRVLEVFGGEQNG